MTTRLAERSSGVWFLVGFGRCLLLLPAALLLLFLAACGSRPAEEPTVFGPSTPAGASPPTDKVSAHEEVPASGIEGIPEARLYVPAIPARSGAPIEVRILASTTGPITGAKLRLSFDPEVLAADPELLPTRTGRFRVASQIGAGSIELSLTGPADGAYFARSTLLCLPMRVTPSTRGLTRSEVRVSGAFEGGSGQPVEGLGTVLVQEVEPALSLRQLADGFDYPVGSTGEASQANDGDGYYNAQDFRVNNHLGEDWNAEAGGNSDYGAPVYACAAGTVVYAANAGGGWGKVIILVHDLPDGSQVKSMYAHLKDLLVTQGDVVRRQQIGTIGTGEGQYVAHLHFEIRNDTSIGLGPGYSSAPTGWLDPSDFIDSNRSLRGTTVVGQGSAEEQHFVDCYNRHGGRAVVGDPIDNGGGTATHWWQGVVIQDFGGGSAGKGAIIDNQGTDHSTAWYLHGSIWEKYAALGGPGSSLGKPTSDEQDAGASPQGTGLGRLTRFENGSIYSSSRGTFPVHGIISDKYEATGGTTGPHGFPVGDPCTVADNVLQQDFEGGRISVLPGNAPGWVGWNSSERNHFAECWDRNGRENDVGNALGPTRWWGTVRPVVLQEFDGGSRGLPVGIIDNEGIPHSTAYCLFGAIWQKYLAIGGPDSPLGRPLSDTWYEGPSPQGTSGRVQDFDGPGEIYKSGRGIFMTYGVIFQKYNAQGRSLGPLGFPTSDPYLENGVLKQNFEGGVLNANLPPKPPVNLQPADQATSNSRAVTFSWADGGDPDQGPLSARQYVCKVRSLTDDSTVATSGWITNTSWTWNAPADGTWYWCVVANDGLSDSDRTAHRILTISAVTPLGAPSGVSATALSTSQIKLTWNDNSSAETGFQVFRKLRASGSYKKIKTLGAGVTSFADSNLYPGTQYFYRLRACNASGVSAYSNEAGATTQGSPPPPLAAPSNLQAYVLSSTSIQLTWNDNSSQESGFQVWRQVSGAGSFRKVKSVGSNLTTASFSGLTPGVSYTFLVRAYDGLGVSPYSNQASATL
ncbi:MAG: fibronectin type III domain-containing protein [Armatimonadetes bacterium]|nr:fibronectin type III domain-containing protein [Armatimonadota bacterium]